MNWLRNFMTGRYGGDQLSTALLILSVLLTLIAEFVGIPILAMISYIPLGICFYRMLSKDISKRRMENYKFAMKMSPVYSWFLKTEKRVQESKDHRFFKCPSCGTSLRLPKGKGNIIITCPKCKTEFKKRT